MRIKLHLERTDETNVLPINYQYELSSWIYNTLNKKGSELTEYLYSQNYLDSHNRYNNFAFSRLLIRDFNIDGDRLIVNSQTCVLTLSFFPVDIPDNLLLNLFKQKEFSIGDKISHVNFRVKSIERVPPPKIKGEMFFKCISPIYMKWRNPRTGRIEHIHPDHKDYERLFFDDLVNKCQIGIPEDEQKDILIDDCFLHVITEPKSILVKIRSGQSDETRIKAYKFYFRLKAPRKLLIAGYYAGFGNGNSKGFGCIEVCCKEDIYSDEIHAPNHEHTFK